MKKTYDISTLDKAPAMTRSCVEFFGTFAQAVGEAHASFNRTGRATAIFSVGGSYPWYSISGDGRVTDNNKPSRSYGPKCELCGQHHWKNSACRTPMMRTSK